MKIPTWLWVIVVVAAATAVHISSGAPVAWLGHLGGFLSGAVLAGVLKSTPTPPTFRRLEARRERRLNQID